MVPGDPESRHMVMCDMRGGIPYHQNQIDYGVSTRTSDRDLTSSVNTHLLSHC